MFHGDAFHGTTILAVRHRGRVAMAGDGQVTHGDTVIKRGARKVRRLHQSRVLAGFAGAVADALTLYDRFEARLDEHRGDLTRAAVEVAREWRTDRVLRLEAMLLVADLSHLLVLSGTGDVIEPDDPIAAIGSEAGYALAAGRALLRHSELGAAEIARTALDLAAEICIYTNDRIAVEELA